MIECHSCLYGELTYIPENSFSSPDGERGEKHYTCEKCGAYIINYKDNGSYYLTEYYDAQGELIEDYQEVEF